MRIQHRAPQRFSPSTTHTERARSIRVMSLWRGKIAVAPGAGFASLVESVYSFGFLNLQHSKPIQHRPPRDVPRTSQGYPYVLRTSLDIPRTSIGYRVLSGKRWKGCAQQQRVLTARARTRCCWAHPLYYFRML